MVVRATGRGLRAEVEVGKFGVRQGRNPGGQGNRGGGEMFRGQQE